MAEICPVLPKDLFIDGILLRLPAKSLGQFRCVSKPWRSLLSSHQFIKAHAKFHTHDPPQNLVLSECWGDCVHISTLCRNGGLSKEVCIPLLNPMSADSTLIVEGSCHGLVLLSQKSNEYSEECSMVLMNPITLEAEKVTNFQLGVDDEEDDDFQQGYDFFTCGLGYDSSNDDYRIVLLSRQSPSITSDYCVDVYSVKTKTWKRAAISKYKYYNHHIDRPDGHSGMFINGCIHWLVFEPDNVIAAFNLAREEFEIVHPPRVINEVGFKSTVLCVLGGCLALVVEDLACTEIWMMKEYGVQDSWMKLNMAFPDDYIEQPPKVVCVLGDDEILVVKDYKQLVAYNLCSGVWRDVVIDGVSFLEFICIRAFTGSLVSPKYKQ